LAASDKFNDPLEDFVYLEYKGDKILWDNMFKEFVVAMEHKMYLAPLYNSDDYNNNGEFDTFMDGNIHGPKVGPYFEHKDYPDRINSILDRFFGYACVSKWSDYLSNRDTHINNEQLIAILNMLSHLAAESILHAYEQLPNKKQFYADFINYFDGLINEIESHNTKLLSAITDSDNEDVVLNTMYLDFQTRMTLHYSTSDLNAKGVSNYYFWFDLPTKFVDELKDFVYYRWYAAAFMKNQPIRMDLWGNYAKDHTGVCLIFKDAKELMVKGIKHLQSGHVEYNNEIITFDFFKRMWVLCGNVLYKDWYSDRHGNVSPLLNEALTRTEDELKEFWASVEKIKYRKNTDWESETEFRFTVDDNWINVSDPKFRSLVYHFNSLEGIVFGVRTTVLNKAMIYKIISDKCKEHSRNDFKFYQARYDKLKGVLVYDELINIGKHTN